MARDIFLSQLQDLSNNQKQSTKNGQFFSVVLRTDLNVCQLFDRNNPL